MKDAQHIAKQSLMVQLARLETANDQLEAELVHVDTLLQAVGFDGGLVSLKAAATEILQDELLDH